MTTTIQSILNEIIKLSDSTENGGNGNGKIDTTKEVSLFNEKVQSKLYEFDWNIKYVKENTRDSVVTSEARGRKVGEAIGGAGTGVALACTTALVSAGPAGWAALVMGALFGAGVGSIVGSKIGKYKGEKEAESYKYIETEKNAFKIAAEQYKCEHQLEMLN